MIVRGAILEADTNHAVKTRLGKNLKDNDRQFFLIGASSPLCVNRKWAGMFRGVANSAWGVIVGNGNRIVNWPKRQSRLACLGDLNRMGEDVIPGFRYDTNARKMDDNWRPSGEARSDIAIDESSGIPVPIAAVPSGDDVGAPNAMPISPSSSLIDVLGDSRYPVMEDALDLGMVYGMWQSIRQFPIARTALATCYCGWNP